MVEKRSFFVPLSDGDIAEKFSKVLYGWRGLAAELDYTGLVAWEVEEGFTLKSHAPEAGSCYENFQYLRDWNIVKGNEPTKNSLVFWVPRLVGNESKTVEEKIAMLAELRQSFGLPEHHLASFGNASILSGLILAHAKYMSEKVPLKGEWARTDSVDSGGRRLNLCGLNPHGLYCDRLYRDDSRRPGLGCFPLGIELAA